MPWERLGTFLRGKPSGWLEVPFGPAWGLCQDQAGRAAASTGGGQWMLLQGGRRAGGLEPRAESLNVEAPSFLCSACVLDLSRSSGVGQMPRRASSFLKGSFAGGPLSPLPQLLGHGSWDRFLWVLPVEMGPAGLWGGSWLPLLTPACLLSSPGPFGLRHHCPGPAPWRPASRETDQSQQHPGRDSGTTSSCRAARWQGHP